MSQLHTALRRLSLAHALTILILALVSSSSAPALALEAPALKGHVNDLASLLTRGEAAALEDKLSAYERGTTNQLVLLTIPSLEGEPIEDFALHVAEQWRLGQSQKDNGLLLVVVPKERKMRIEVGYGLEGSVPDALAGRIIRNVLAPAFRREDYSGGINLAFDTLTQAIGGQPVTIQDRAPPATQGSPWMSLIWIGIIVLLMFTGSGRSLLWFFLGAMMSGRGGGGGFRGGGGGFGGGGGGFGGGGASGDW